MSTSLTTVSSVIALPGKSDIVSNMMTIVFGNAWSNVLNGGLSSIDLSLSLGSGTFSDMFKVWNASIFLLTSLYISKIVIQSISDSSTHGELMGKQVSTLGSGFRFTSMLFMVAPAGSSGYCIAQLIVMYCLALGVGIANNVANIFITDVAAMGALQPPVIVQDATPFVATLYAMEICHASLDLVDEIHAATSTGTTPTSPYSVAWTQAGNEYTLASTSTEPGKVVNCGSIDLATTAAPSIISNVNSTISTAASTVSTTISNIAGVSSPIAPTSAAAIINPATNTINFITTYITADAGTASTSPLYQMIRTGLISSLCKSQTLVTQASSLQTICGNSTTIANANDLGKAVVAAAPITSKQLAMPDPNIFNSEADALISAITLDAAAIAGSNTKFNGMSGIITAVSNNGFGALGSLMPVISNLQGAIDAAANDIMPKARVIWSIKNGTVANELSSIGLSPAPTLKLLNTYKESQAYSASTSGSSTNGLLSQAQGSMVAATSASNGAMSIITGWETKLVGTGINMLSGLNYTDPMASIQGMGDRLILIGVTIETTLSVAANAVEAVAATSIVVAPESSAVIGFMKKAMTMLASISKALILAGAILAFVIPFMSYFIYTMAILGWLVAAIIAIIGAPLWAASHAMPSGDDLIGQTASNGYKMLASLIAKPTLIVFGFAASFAIFSASIYLIQSTYLDAVQAVLSGAVNANSVSGLIASLIGIVASIIIAVALVYTVTKYSFSVIHLVPDLALRWAGLEDISTNEDSLHSSDTYAYITAAKANVMTTSMATSRGEDK